MKHCSSFCWTSYYTYTHRNSTSYMLIAKNRIFVMNRFYKRRELLKANIQKCYRQKCAKHLQQLSQNWNIFIAEASIQSSITHRNQWVSIRLSRKTVVRATAVRQILNQVYDSRGRIKLNSNCMMAKSAKLLAKTPNLWFWSKFWLQWSNFLWTKGWYWYTGKDYLKWPKQLLIP